MLGGRNIVRNSVRNYACLKCVWQHIYINVFIYIKCELKLLIGGGQFVILFITLT